MVTRYLTTGQAAKLLGLSQQTIIRCFDAGIIKGFVIPGSRYRRIDPVALGRFAREHCIPFDEPKETK